MREHRYLIGALVAGLITAGLIYQILTGFYHRAPVLVAARDIPAYTRVEEGMLDLAFLPSAAVHPQSLNVEEDALGRYTVAPLVAGEMVLEAKLSPGAGGTTFLSDLGVDERAIFIPLTLARGLGGAVARGQEVDVVYVSTRERGTEPGAWTLLHRLRVLDVRSEKGRTLGEKGEGGIPAGILVAVKEEEAEKLAYCLETGSLYLALNPPSLYFEPRMGGEDLEP